MSDPFDAINVTLEEMAAAINPMLEVTGNEPIHIGSAEGKQ